MRKVIATAGLLWVALAASAQDITGDWTGLLKAGAIQVHIVFHITRQDTGYNALMDSPDQGVNGIPVASARLVDGRLTLEVAQPKIEYSGEWRDSLITGTFRQAGLSFPLEMRRGMPAAPVRPQTPVRPYPYVEEEVRIENKGAGVVLAGTLTLPPGKGRFPAVVLITGSGPQDRDESLMGHKPFLVIADALTRRGIAVLRYDDRGTARSTGDFRKATTADFATDVEAAVAYLKTRKEVNARRIGLIGHSEGGIIAPLVASRNGDIRCIVLLAGPGLRGEEILLSQQQLIGQASGGWGKPAQEMVDVNRGAMDIIVRDSLRLEHADTIKQQLAAYFEQRSVQVPALKSGGPEVVRAAIGQLTSPWMEYFLAYDPAPALERVRCPVLAMAGSKDLQVPPEENLVAIGRALEKGGNTHFEVKEFPDLNHLFQECTTGLPGEYAKIEQTFAPAALEFMVNWVVKQCK
ncbi:MAG TPA: alpha/beta fold hydrolase [Puia sp.]|uniref:alpha/beta hydrolase family protein n=1 Tax=Puia sp. TaxID=2045100 RepID=UPI002BB6A27E|nr:alpha/beta fold hydrolase [Puia sp.]HVU98594.1 alpha/beta fold hydrolase [Puia sp.]